MCAREYVLAFICVPVVVFVVVVVVVVVFTELISSAPGQRNEPK